MTERARRQQRILDHIASGSVRSQESLQELLAAEGIQVAQATLSRDLRELGVAKGPTGYLLPGQDRPQNGERTLGLALRSLALSIERGAATVVIKTGPGRAQYVAFELDRSPPTGVIGTLAGDDTIFVAAESDAAAERIEDELRELAGLVPAQGVRGGA